MRPALLILALLAPAAAAAGAAAPARNGEARQLTVDLAYALGEAHALVQACGGGGDQSWRARMVRMLETEEMDPGFLRSGRRRLVESFNAGFSARRAEFPACRPAASDALRTTAARGESLARRLAGTGEAGR